ncbi:phenylpyruvate tautomerase MIF-related protein [Magnetospira sp. QH-2]|uniref:phenylpyruvate tautomerase MIF-related protein n=1 Tax=Magnetospira sp. (strain QH-2) TaxID=1288970 RepID=UPI0003E81C39|nr:phenylpyruvate tautomerase MIF-related protein [Magnetospira sp. QH-2]CCQ73217.1 Phenylpyruvate tautomerase. Similar to Macrophage migration inhibitory factor from Eukaryote [Magnetospira sp. QH-2]
MPLLTLRTNVPIAEADQIALMAELSHQMASALGKPESYVMVTLEAGRAMMFGGSESPTVLLQLKSLGLGTDQTNGLSELLSALVETNLGIPADRTYIEFSSPERAFWGWNGKTFA